MPSIHASSPPYNELVPGYFDVQEEETSAGTSSSVSEKKPEWSGSSGTPDLPSPAQDAESLSEQDPALSAVQSSSASSTDGSTQETTPSLPDQPDSSEESAPAKDPTPDQAEAERLARDMIQAARDAYEAKDYVLAEQRLNDADEMWPPIKAETEVAHAAVAAATTS